MTSQEERSIIMALLEKTRTGEVPWQESVNLISALYPENVGLTLPRSSVALYRVTGMGQPKRDTDPIAFKILNENGTAVIDLSVYPTESDYPLLDELLTRAIRQSRKIDETINDLREFLKDPRSKRQPGR